MRLSMMSERPGVSAHPCCNLATLHHLYPHLVITFEKYTT